jgi:hypothetical protein
MKSSSGGATSTVVQARNIPHHLSLSKQRSLQHRSPMASPRSCRNVGAGAPAEETIARLANAAVIVWAFL